MSVESGYFDWNSQTTKGPAVPKFKIWDSIKILKLINISKVEQCSPLSNSFFYKIAKTEDISQMFEIFWKFILKLEIFNWYGAAI